MKNVTTFAQYQAAQIAEAEAWLEAHADELRESQSRDERMMTYGSEYFDLDAQDVTTDDLDYVQYNGLFDVSDCARHRESGDLLATPTGEFERPSNPLYTPRTDHVNIYLSDDLTPPVQRAAAVLPPSGNPVRYTPKQADALRRHLAREATARRLHGIADIVGRTTSAHTVSNAARIRTAAEAQERKSGRAAQRMQRKLAAFAARSAK
jgi:hypothetical protein